MQSASFWDIVKNCVEPVAAFWLFMIEAEIDFEAFTSWALGLLAASVPPEPPQAPSESSRAPNTEAVRVFFIGGLPVSWVERVDCPEPTRRR